MSDEDVDVAVSRVFPELTPAAVLLTDTPEEAVRLLGVALGRPGALDSGQAALSALAAAVHRSSGEQVIGSLDPAPADEDDALAGALRALPAPDRAAAVLQLLGAGPQQDADAAVAALRVALAGRDEQARAARDLERSLFAVPGATAEPALPAAPLPERLARLAAGRRLPSTAADTVAGMVSTARAARRRRRVQLVAGALVVLALAVVVPLLPRGAPAPTPTSTPTSPAAVPVPEGPSVYAGAPRGSLAGDEAFSAGLRELDWPPARAADPRRVVYAGDVPGGRWALLTSGGTAARPAAAAWFTGPEGAAPGGLRLTSGWSTPDPTQPAALVDPATGTLVVLAAPDDQIAVSGRPEVTGDGTVLRAYGLASTTAGLAEVHLEPLPGAVGSAVQLLWRRAGRPPEPLAPAVVPTEAATGTPPLGRLRPAPEPARGDAAVGPQLASVLGRLGQSAGDAAVTVLWAGDLPGPHEQPARVTVLAVGQPSGAAVVTAPYGLAGGPTGAAGTSVCVTGVLPAGEPLDQRVVALRCDVTAGFADPASARSLVVLAARDAVSVQLFDVAGTVLGEQPLTDGVAVVGSPGDVARVLVRGAGGEVSGAAVLTDADLSG
ncbi:hypothetical protein [Modestobacter altitudinis]|uniref:hypothetical protein n=1 Tax=Modestobacter altitudinis TaxID=2213158 RepID=UPI00110CB719|nr:hypothetical protein [Modestobacter altitudinis]